MTNTISKAMLWGASTSLLALSGPAYAQLDEIIVTATKTAKSLQDVPASIVAFDADKIARLQIDSFEDVAQFTPGLLIYPSAADSNGVRINLRGIGSFDPQLGLDSKVALYVDGLYMGKTQGLAFDSPDLERVEVLKGPQGTLYGRNAVAGAINLISGAPDPSDSYAKMNLEYGNYNHLKANAVINTRLSDKAAFRVSGQVSKRDGWVKNDGLGEDFAGYDRFSLRGALGVEASDKLDLTIAADYAESENQPYFYQAVPGTNTDTAPFFSVVPGLSDDRKERVTTGFDNGSGNLENSGITFTADYRLNDDHDLKFVAGTRRANGARFVTLLPETDTAALNEFVVTPNAAFGGLAFNSLWSSLPLFLGVTGADPAITIRDGFTDMVPRDPVNSIFASHPDGNASLDGHKQYSAELTASGSFADSKIDYTAGVYYFDEDTSNGRVIQPTNQFDVQDYLTIFPGLELLQDAIFISDDPDTPDLDEGVQAEDRLRAFFDGARNTAQGIIDIRTKAYAAYGQATYHVSDDFRLTGGLRYSYEDKSGFQRVASPFFNDLTSLLGNDYTANEADTNFDSLDPTFVAEYDLNDDTLLYASYSQAFRSGGFNQVASASKIPGETYGADFIFNPEDITSYEAGLKGVFMDRRLSFNLSGFYYQLKNEQVAAQVENFDPTVRAIVNADTDMWGFETDAQIVLSDEFTATAGYTFVDGNPDDLIGPNGNVTERRELQASPKHSFSTFLNYNKSLNTNFDMFAGLGYNYKSKSEYLPVSGGYWVTNQNLVTGNIGFTRDNGNGTKAKFTLWGQNLLDDKYTTDIINFGALAYDIEIYGTPRTYGVSLGMEF